jgi:hypothetical protein
MITRKPLLALVVAAALLASGCASVPMADTTQDTAAKTFVAPRDKAGIYIFRNETFGAAVKMDVFVDGQPLGETVAKSYFYVEVEPGIRTVTGKSENESSVRFHALAGKLYFIWQEVKMGLLYARNELKLVDEKEGRTGVMESQRVQKTSVK